MYLGDVEVGAYDLGKVRIYADRCDVVEVRILLLEVVDATGEVGDALLIVGRVEAGEVDAAEAELEDLCGIVSVEIVGNDLLHFLGNLLIIEVDVVFV